MTLLDAGSRENLLSRARAAISRAIGAEPLPKPQSLPGLEPFLSDDLRAGAFVTLRMNGVLRGCIGYPEPELPLIDVVERCAVSAALSDPRFPPVTVSEWKAIDLEISVLGPIEVVGHISEIEVGRHGLVVESGRRCGLLLPQVAIEWQWDAREFASQTCAKAGLPRDAWQKGATLYRFEAEVFGESG
jgi:AmmeMemoRadiSam system protein A